MRRTAKIKLAAQKKSLHALERESERVTARRAEYRDETSAIDLSKFKFLDEAGSNLAMTRTRGRAAKGERLVDAVPQNYGENITMLGALSVSGIKAPMTINGAVDGLVPTEYVKQVARAAKVGARVIYLPPYSPDLNPIEKCWSKIKTFLRAAKARTRAELEKALAEALRLISPKDAEGWMRSCGYTIH